MPAEMNVARDEMLALFKAAWDPTTHPVLYDDVPGPIPSPGTPYARVTIRHSIGFQATLSGETGNRRFRQTGLLTVQVFTPFGKGLVLSDSLGIIVRNAFEGKTTAGGVLFRNVRPVEVGQDGAWFQMNVLAEFEYDRIK